MMSPDLYVNDDVNPRMVGDRLETASRVIRKSRAQSKRIRHLGDEERIRVPIGQGRDLTERVSDGDQAEARIIGQTSTRCLAGREFL